MRRTNVESTNQRTTPETKVPRWHNEVKRALVVLWTLQDARTTCTIPSELPDVTQLARETLAGDCSDCHGRGNHSNVAVIVLSPFMVPSMLRSVPPAFPLQPLKVAVPIAAAVKVITWPCL